MATVSVVFGPRAADDVGAMRTRARVSEAMTSSATSSISTNAAHYGEYIEVTPLGDVWVDFSPTPEAASGITYLVPTGVTRQFKAEAGDKVAVIDAA